MVCVASTMSSLVSLSPRLSILLHLIVAGLRLLLVFSRRADPFGVPGVGTAHIMTLFQVAGGGRKVEKTCARH